MQFFFIHKKHFKIMFSLCKMCLYNYISLVKRWWNLKHDEKVKRQANNTQWKLINVYCVTDQGNFNSVQPVLWFTDIPEKSRVVMANVFAISPLLLLWHMRAVPHWSVLQDWYLLHHFFTEQESDPGNNNAKPGRIRGFFLLAEVCV